MRKVPKRRPTVETLEHRRVMAGLPEGQLFLYLLNEARSNPAAYQQSSGISVDLSGVAKRQPLAWNASLQQSAQFHSNEMATHDYFAHQSAVTGQWPNANVRAHGYKLPSWFPDDTNYLESIGAGTLRTTAEEGLKPLIVSPSHRNHLLGIDAFNAGQREAAIGYALNAKAFYTNYWTVHATRTDPTGSFLTGVVFDDLNDNGRYDLNEGTAGIVVKVGSTQTVTNAAGGWSLGVAENQRHVVSVQTSKGVVTTAVEVAQLNREIDVRVDSQTVRVDFGGWAASADVVPPTATLTPSFISLRHVPNHIFEVLVHDDVQLNSASLKTGSVVVVGPNGFQQTAKLVSAQPVGNDWKATYEVVAPDGQWTSKEDGSYSVQTIANQITDSSGNAMPAAVLGTFQVLISQAHYAEDINDDSIVSPVDVLLVINHINAAKPFDAVMDVNRDQSIGPTDALAVINFLNASGAGEGEAARRDIYFADLEERQRKNYF